MAQQLHYRAYSIRVRPEERENYLRLHQAVWPEVEQVMRRAGVDEYRIFITDDNQLFSLIGFQEGYDMQTLVEEYEKSEICCRWSNLTGAMQEKCSFAKEKEWWTELLPAYVMEGKEEQP